MYSIYSTVKERLSRYLMAESLLLEDSFSGSNELSIASEDINSFNEDSLNDIYPHLILMDENTTGERDATGFEGAELVIVTSLDHSKGKIYLRDPLKRDWLSSAKSHIRRSPGGVPVAEVKIGDIKVVSRYPTVCVVPTTKSIQWFTLNSTKDTVSIDVMIYVESGDTEQGTIDMLKISDVVEWIMMSNLHLKVEGAVSPYAVTSNAGVKDVNYGVIQKGNEFLKASKVSWFGELHIDRSYLVGKPRYERISDTI